MALSDFWGSRQKRQDAAMSFLTTGSNAYNRLNITGSNSQGCIDSSDCASGWSCSGGRCRQKDTGAGVRSYGTSTGCGDDNTNQPRDSKSGGGGGGDCGAGVDEYIFQGEPEFINYLNNLSNNLQVGDDPIVRSLIDRRGNQGRGIWGISQGGKCLKTGCGGYRKKPDGGPDTCCGQGRCCRFSAYGVQCYCGECPDPPGKCNEWCTDYRAANGVDGQGCDGQNTCSECEQCSKGGGDSLKCIKKSDGPCYCGGSGCNGECDACGEDGTCESDCSNCKTCYQTFKQCDCGTIPVTCCYPACDQTKGYTDCRNSVQCVDLCNNGKKKPDGSPVDECAGNCDTITTCDDQPPPPCPPKSSCRQSGSITVGDRTCILTEVCDKSEVPDSCGECDCNCENDCPDCQYCGADGKCKPDPTCDETHYAVIAFFTHRQTTNGSARFDPTCVPGCTQYTSQIAEFGGIIGEEGDLGPGITFVAGDPSGPFLPNGCDGEPCIPGDGCFGSSYFTQYAAMRSDGVTPAYSGYRGRDLFKGKYTSRTQFSNTLVTRVPLQVYQFLGLGSTSVEAYTDARQKANGMQFDSVSC